MAGAFGPSAERHDNRRRIDRLSEAGTRSRPVIVRVGQIYFIDTVDDLDRLVAVLPLPLGHLTDSSGPNWEAMTASGWDAVYVSEAGLTASADRIPIAEPSLGRWDRPSILWLRPAYGLVTP